MKALIVAPHPDDEVLGCGATLVKLADAGVETRVVILTDRTFPTGQGRKPDHVRAAAETAKVCELLSVGSYDMGRFKLRTLQDRFTDLVDYLERERDTFRPDFVYLPSGLDTHQEHRATWEAAQVVWRPHFCVPNNVRVLAYQTPSSYGFQPNYWETVQEDHVALKIAAMNVYECELLPAPSTRCPEFLNVQARYWGHITRAVTGFAEPFTYALGGS